MMRVADGDFRDLAAAHQRLELAVRNLPPAGRQEQRLPDRQHQQQRRAPTRGRSAGGRSSACSPDPVDAGTGQRGSWSRPAILVTVGGLELASSDVREPESVALGVDHDVVALAELAFQHAQRQRVEHQALDAPASAAGRRRSDHTLPAPASPWPPSVSSTWIFRSSSRFSRPRSWMSMICAMCSRRQRVEEDRSRRCG